MTVIVVITHAAKDLYGERLSGGEKYNFMKEGAFNELSLVDKAWLISEFGEFIMSIEYYDERIHLYCLNGLLVELYYNMNARQIHRISSIAYAELDKYLSRIYISGVKTILR